MAWVALVLSLLVALTGAIGVVSPQVLIHLARRLQSTAGLYTAAALRIVMGISLILAAPASRAPQTLRVVGVVVLVVGLVTPLFGVDGARRILDWWSARGPLLMRAWAGLALVVGALLAYAVLP